MESLLNSIRSNIAKRQARDSSGKFVSKDEPANLPPFAVNVNSSQKVSTTNPPDLFSFRLTNPLVYIKYWWKRIMANEGIEVKLKAKPLTVFGVALIAFSLAFGLGGVMLPTIFPWMKVNNQIVTTQTPTPTPEVLKDTALKGTLMKTNSTPTKFYLVTTSTEAVYLEVPAEINLLPLVGKRILAIGSYNSKDKILEVEDIQDLEVLSNSPQPIPVSSPTPIATPTATPIPTGTPVPSETPVEPTLTPSPISSN